jgi:hypothetical protein
MEMNVGREVAALQRMTVKQLRQKYAEVFGEDTNGHNKAWLVKRIAWRLQARAEGGLSDRARQRAMALADDADLRMNPPPMKAVPPVEDDAPVRVLKFQADDRLPPPGTVITRKYKGEVLQVKVRTEGFEYEGVVYTSLSAVAKRITGSHCNGFLFFRLDRKGDDA